MQVADLLIEIGTEELPPTALFTLMTAFGNGIIAHLDRQQIGHGDAQLYSTPRRLAVIIQAVAATQPARETQRRGPALAAAFDATGAPTPAAIGFANSCGVAVNELTTLTTDKGQWLIHQAVTPGQITSAALPDIIYQVLRELPIPKRMRWGAGTAEFVRPIHWINGLFGNQPIAGEVMGIAIQPITYGHRFHSPAAIELTQPSEYVQALREHFVEPDFAVRRQLIQQQVNQLAQSVNGQAIYPEALLDEITALCEWPVALLGQFDSAFLAVPQEVLIETMQKNQKYVPLFTATGAELTLLPHFIVIANIASQQPDVVQHGNERVIRPRFTDAQFFWEQDRKQPLATRLPQLDQVVFQEQLGSIGERARRIVQVMQFIAAQLKLSPALCERAALLAKADLVTQMVGEFGNLQGVMGRYYAQHSGEDDAVAIAIEEQYLPRQAGDHLPMTAIGRALALADRVDTLTGVFAIGQRPTGVKDPYGVRRAAIAVLRILIESPLPLDLKQLFTQSAATFPDSLNAATVVDEVFNYCAERLASYYLEQGIAVDCVDAVLALGITRPADLNARIRAVAQFRTLPAADSLAAASKRIGNILKKAPAVANQTDDKNAIVDSELLIEPAELALATALQTLTNQITPLLAIGDYTTALMTLAQLRTAVDQFFDAVMVMTEDLAIQRNRLALLAALQKQLFRIADISRLQP
ncbi:glycine--tRNA ligase subunit beta [Thiospirillum jenense]|uniref:Glycine--tRNA ligase beta subunit n=1 Tax=Thiospirillum jenense TaxID=1653858 RepID=A0A839HJ77_9GAMM|nr:glycine--tRNA ligase subunit beta [Thiospirillum jenense]MBB1127046.1 glycine--tRNA ligase subunit beta [Thiospirillum jenense]